MRASRSPRRASSRAQSGADSEGARSAGSGLETSVRDTAARLAASGRRASARMGSVVTPLRATLAVAAVAAVTLGVSQFLDYRGVAVGAGDYAAYPDIEAIAPPPQVDRDPAGSAHAYLLLPVAIIALVAIVLAFRGRVRLVRLAAALGLFSLAVILIVDRPAGLDEGVTVVRFEGAEASLEYGFYLELVAAAVLVAGSLIASRYVRSAVPESRRDSGRPAPAPRLREARG